MAGVERWQTTEWGLLGIGGSRDLEPQPDDRQTHHVGRGTRRPGHRAGPDRTTRSAASAFAAADHLLGYRRCAGVHRCAGWSATGCAPTVQRRSLRSARCRSVLGTWFRRRGPRERSCRAALIPLAEPIAHPSRSDWRVGPVRATWHDPACRHGARLRPRHRCSLQALHALHTRPDRTILAVGSMLVQPYAPDPGVSPLGGIWRRGDFCVPAWCFGDRGPVPAESAADQRRP